jgi:hypothetical protein
VALRDKYRALWQGVGLVGKNEYFGSFHMIMTIRMSSNE